ncbi:unnamed protein product [Medioppia subpectinata]|uniref:Non-specific serine/threonine protein kinase n=1 Tax=Medioppia subpectinata TaxID=1979941 RepID=A0A7R9PUG8_9ACAR|nr:unnamed protein product [Medioppia subpectinata]CAG2101560.1 unnamed protein product [Medioppia subpectinata]
MALFKNEFQLSQHNKNVHQNIQFTCDFSECDKVFKSKQMLTRHKFIVHSYIDKNHKYFQCFWPKCQFKAITKSMLKTHQLNHSKIRQFKCDFNDCNKLYKQKSHLDRHKRITHLNERFVCDFNECYKTFTNKSYLSEHKNSVHLNERKFKCDEQNCGKIFKSKSNLLQHQRLHSGDKPFDCDFNGCNKSFAKKTQLQDHMNRHLNIKKFKCHFGDCNKEYAAKVDLKKHIMSVHCVHSMYSQSSRLCRTVVRTATPVGARSCAHFGDKQTIRTQFASKEHLKQSIESALSQTMFSTSKVVVDGRQTLLSTKQKVLLLCDPNEVIDFEDVFDPQVLKTCRKIGEGSYGEVFMAKDRTGKDVVIKVIALITNGGQEEEELFSHILPELVISKEFNKLKTGLTANRAPNYIHMLRVTATRGLFPQKLMDAWNAFDDEKTSENDDPNNYTEDQLYVVLQLANGGSDLEARQFESALETLSICAQLALSLAAAEMAYEFEHRDMHWGNVLVSTAHVSHLEYCVNGKSYSLRANGVFASLIDYSLSRMSSDGFVIYDDLEKYGDLFEGRGDYQFDVYRKMRVNNQNDWQKEEVFVEPNEESPKLNASPEVDVQ